jgi:hypothetical protein
VVPNLCGPNKQQHVRSHHRMDAIRGWNLQPVAMECRKNRDGVMAKLKAVGPQLRAHGVAALYLFGSYARDEAREDSDVDVFGPRLRGRLATAYPSIMPTALQDF